MRATSDENNMLDFGSYLTDSLKDPEEAQAYLDAVWEGYKEDDDAEFFMDELRELATASGVLQGFKKLVSPATNNLGIFSMTREMSLVHLLKHSPSTVIAFIKNSLKLDVSKIETSNMTASQEKMENISDVDEFIMELKVEKRLREKNDISYKPETVLSQFQSKLI